jgi:hypothetical protein
MQRKQILKTIFGFLIVSSIISNSVYAVEYLRDEEPAPGSVEDLGSPIGNTFKIIPRKEILFPRLSDYVRDYIKGLPTFFSDTQLDLNIRSFYFDRNRGDGSISTAWALGGSIFYESGKLFDLISVGGEVFTSQKLYGPEDKDGSGLLGPGQEGFTVIGRAYGKLNYEEKLEVKLYRQYINAPYVNKQDIRMVPITFEAYKLIGNLGDFRFGGGYISKIKRQNSDKFVPMSQIGSIKDTDNGMFAFGGLYTPVKEFAIGGINYFVQDVINIFYAESYYLKTTDSGAAVKLSAQVTDQRSVGDDLLGSDFSTQVWGGQIAASYVNTILRFAFSTVSSDKEIISPYGGYPGYLSLMVKDFKRASEKAFLAGLSHDFESVGLEGLSFFTNYAFGYDAVDSMEDEPLPDQREFDITIDYKPEELAVRGLWLRFRYANVDISGNEDSINDLRLILNYNLPAL